MPSMSRFEEQKAILRLAFENGIREIDTSNNYGFGAVETQLKLLLQDFSESDFKLSTKVYFPMSESAAAEGLSRASLHKNIDQSLLRLGRNSVDRYICHRWDPQTPLEETIEACNKALAHGKHIQEE